MKFLIVQTTQEAIRGIINLSENQLIFIDTPGLVRVRKHFNKKLSRSIMENENIILFVDELHTLVGAGAAEGSVDASNMLKPTLSRGEIQCIGATTLEEYRKYIEKNGALERRFQPITVNPPPVRRDTLNFSMYSDMSR